MRYGLSHNRNWKTARKFFPVQSSVLDEEILLSEAVSGYCIPEAEACRFLSRGDSDIYRVRTAGEHFYLKIYRPPQSLEGTEAEALFVTALSASDIPVVKPVQRKDGHYAFQVTAPEGKRPMLLYEAAPPPLPGELTEKIAAAIGEKVALFHKAADRFNTSFGLPETDLKAFFDENGYYTSQFLSDPETAYFKEVSRQLEDWLQKRPRSKPGYGLCHADLVLSNIRLDPDGAVRLFDFGNARRTWRASEFAVLDWSLGKRYKEGREVLWQALLGGYQSTRPLPEALSEDLPFMLVLRQIGFLGGNCATLPLRLGTEPFESGFIEREMERLRQLVEKSGLKG